MQRLFLDRPLGWLHAIGKFVDQIVDGGQDRIERIAIARQDPLAVTYAVGWAVLRGAEQLKDQIFGQVEA